MAAITRYAVSTAFGTQIGDPILCVNEEEAEASARKLKESGYTVSVKEVQIKLTPEEVYSIFRIKDHEYLLEDAKSQLYSFAGIVEGNEEAYPEENQIFTDKYGNSIDEMCNESSDYYILEDLVEQYSHYQDCEQAENDVWQTVIRLYLRDWRKAS